MAQSLEVNIKTNSDVPQAMDKAKTATTSFGKQVDDIQKKFSTSFKDIFLGFAAPMVLIQSAISLITSAIEKAKQDAKEGYALMIKGDNQFVTSNDRRMAMGVQNQILMNEDREKIEAAKKDATVRFLKSNAGSGLYSRLVEENMADWMINPRFTYEMAAIPAVQMEAAKLFAETPQGRAIQFAEEKSKELPPAALGSGVIGVGASPQITLAMEANTTLASIDSKLGELVNAGIASDPTKPLGRKFPLYSPGMTR